MKTFDRQDKVILSRQFVLVLVDLAKQNGLHPDKVLKGTRCFIHDLNQIEHRVSSNELLTIIDNVLHYCSRNDLSFILGKKYFPSQLGTLEQAFLNCKNIRNMLKLCLLFQYQLCPFIFIKVIKSRGKTHLIMNSAIGKVTTTQQRFLYEFVLTTILAAIKYRLGKAIPVTIKVPYKTVDYIEQYHVNLGGGVTFDKQVAMMSFDNRWLDLQISDCSSALKNLALSEARQVRNKERRIGFVQAVCQFISKNLHQQDISLDNCAQTFEMSIATLKRKLAQHQTSYQLLLDQMRCQYAVLEMIENKQSNEHIAIRLKFNDVTNFRRSFKRWTGMTPIDFRKKNGAIPNNENTTKLTISLQA